MLCFIVLNQRVPLGEGCNLVWGGLSIYASAQAVIPTFPLAAAIISNTSALGIPFGVLLQCLDFAVICFSIAVLSAPSDLLFSVFGVQSSESVGGYLQPLLV